MRLSKRTVLALIVGSLSGFMLSPAFADGPVVTATLWDSGENAMDMMGQAAPMGMGMKGANMMGGAMKMTTMGIKLDKATVPAGEITFRATNTSTSLIHEMVLSPVTDPNKPLPYNEAEYKVDEDAAVSLGEVEELDPGQAGSLTVRLKPGTYILFCNIPGHYMMGMWTLLTVEG